MTNNSHSIHVESGNIFYQNFNTNETFCSLFIAQQDKTKAIILKGISYHYSFENYTNKYIPSFSIDDAENLVSLQIKILNISFINLMIKLKL